MLFAGQPYHKNNSSSIHHHHVGVHTSINEYSSISVFTFKIHSRYRLTQPRAEIFAATINTHIGEISEEPTKVSIKKE